MSDSDFQNPDGKENQAERGLKGEPPFRKDYIFGICIKYS